MIDVVFSNDSMVYFDMVMKVSKDDIAGVDDVQAMLDKTFSSTCQTVFTDLTYYVSPYVLPDATTILPTTTFDLFTTTVNIESTIFETTTISIQEKSNKCQRN
jgi:hypothetical protein